MKKVIIIGAGVSGLSAGITLASDGIDVEIFDLSPSAGGMCRAWFRKGYRFDSCIQWMAGVREGDPVFELYRQVGALADDTEVYYPKSIAIEIDGTALDVPLEIGSFRDFLKEQSDEDAPAVDALCADIETLIRTLIKPCEQSGLTGALVRLRDSRDSDALWHRYAGKTVGELAAAFKSERIGKILVRLAPDSYSAYAFFNMLGVRMSGNAGYPLGGAAGVIERMTERFSALGGRLHLGEKADEIIVAGGEASGVRSGGTTFTADGVIAAGLDPGALESLLDRRFPHPQLNRFLQRGPLYEPLAVVSYGLRQQLGIPYALTCACPEGVGVAPGIRRHGFALRAFDFDPSAAPPDCSSVMALLNVPLDYWKRLRAQNPASYRLQKELLADHVASKIEMRYPGFRDAVEITDVATPASFLRMTNACRGSLEGFPPTPEVIMTPVKKTLPGLGRFCLCGQWTSPGGGIGAAIAGGHEAAAIMKREIRQPLFAVFSAISAGKK